MLVVLFRLTPCR